MSMELHYGDWHIVRKIGSGTSGTVYEIAREDEFFNQKPNFVDDYNAMVYYYRCF